MRFLFVILLFFQASLLRASSIGAQGYLADLRLLFQTFERDYAYGPVKHLDWKGLQKDAEARIKQVKTDREFIRLLEEILDSTYDPHNMLNVNLKDSWYPVPRDLWASEEQGVITIEAVRADSPAAKAGVKIGDRIRKINGVDIAQAIEQRMPKALLLPDPAARQWALLSVLGGRRGTARVLEFDDQRTLTLADAATDSGQDVRWRRLDANAGWIQIPDFTSDAQVKAFDQALEEFREAHLLIIDLRGNSGGDTLFAKPMLGRLIDRKQPYAWMGKMKQGHLMKATQEFIEPRGPWTWKAGVVVLVDHFAVSMAEGFAMAVQGMGRGSVVGTAGGGLGAAIERYELPRTKISWQLSREPVFQLNGAPRDAFQPQYPVKPQADRDAFLEKARELAKLK